MPIWLQQLLVLLGGGALLLWTRRSERLKSSKELRRTNWWTVPLLATVIAEVILEIAARNGAFKLSHVFYGIVFVAAYTGFVYLWNRFEHADDATEDH